MQFIRERVLGGDFVAGTWCSMASAMAVEMMGLAGYDWVLLDKEHAPSTADSILSQLQALRGLPTAPIIRIPWLDQVEIKWSLDLGASGIMVPYVETADSARFAVSCMRYPPEGKRGIGAATRASDYGYDWPAYSAAANSHLLTVIQVETGRTLTNLDSIAEVDGVDVLFVGPMDLSASLDMPKRFADPEFMDVLDKVAKTARKHGKASGILLPEPSLVPKLRDLGYSFIAVGSDSGILAARLRENLGLMR